MPALAYGKFKVGAIETILRNAHDLEPLEEFEPPIPSAKLEAPRFARSIAELVVNNLN